ncbi:MAG: hypothetical protein JW885_04350 [Deltaproteobacteria bacterium]|nr:hypothetical protein [Candidatus Zymogenaceae bacterium]
MDRIRRTFFSQRGEGRGKTFAVIIVIAIIVYAAAKFFPPIKTHMDLKKVVEEYMWSNGGGSEEIILERLSPRIAAVKEDLGRDDIVIVKKGNQNYAMIDYTETVVLIPDMFEHELKFHVEGFSKPQK